MSWAVPVLRGVCAVARGASRSARRFRPRRLFFVTSRVLGTDSTLFSVLARDRVESAYLTYECVRVWVVSKDTGVWTMDSEYVLGSARCYTSETYK